MKRAVITGPTGAIGTALTEKLTGEGTEVLLLCRKDSKRLRNISENPLVTVRFCALNELSEATNDTGREYDVFYHLAWAGAAGPGRNDMYLQNDNVRYALDAVAAAKRFGCRTFIGAGSQAEYGRAEGQLRPDTPAFPETGYGFAKLCAGLMTRQYAHQLGLNHIWVRILSVYGPCDGEQSMVMSTIGKLTKGETPQFTPGGQLWDYLYSKDAAAALSLLGDKGKDGKTYVLGSGRARPLAEYIRLLRDAVDPKAELAIGALPYGPNQVMHLEADISELKKDTGFQPGTAFEDGIRETVEKTLMQQNTSI